MAYKVGRARKVVTEPGRAYEVSKVCLSTDGHVSAVLWNEVDTASGHVVADCDGARRAIVLAGPAASGHGVHDMDRRVV